MKTTGLLFILVCATSLSVPAQTALENDDAQTVRSLEHAWFEAQSHNDNRALDLIFDNAPVYVEYGSLISKGDYLLRVKSAKPQLEQIVMEALTVHTFGGTAIAVGTYREPAEKDAKSLLMRWRFVDTWVYEKGRWMLVAAAAAPLSK